MKLYVIKDSNGRYDCSMGLGAKNADGTGIEWYYCSNSHATRCHTRLDVAQRELTKLKKLNSLAGFNVDFSIVEFKVENMSDAIKKVPMIASNSIHKDFTVDFKDIPRWYIGKTKKAVREICKNKII